MDFVTDRQCARCGQAFGYPVRAKIFAGELVCLPCAELLEQGEGQPLPEATMDDFLAPPPSPGLAGPMRIAGAGLVINAIVLGVALAMFGLPLRGTSLQTLIQTGQIWGKLLHGAFIVGCLVLLVWTTVVYFQRKRIARPLMVGLMLLNVVLLILSQCGLLSGILPAANSLHERAMTPGPGMAWLLYFLLSDRVKQTFVR